MAWRTLHLANPARLSLAHHQLAIHQEGGETCLPLEDIAAIILDTPQATLTSALLSACMASGVAILVTDQRHHPSGLVLPFHQHHKQSEIAASQIALTPSTANRLWRQLVQAKLANQAAHLAELGRNAAPITAMAHLIAPGDPDNIEARAARHYWGELFENFTRHDAADPRNAMLDYAYAVLRAAIARALVGAGLLPCFGLHHASAQNPFNLADDLLEPFRPFADRLVHRLATATPPPALPLPRATRQTLASLLFDTLCIGPETLPLLAATERAASTLVRAMQTGRATLALPTWPEPK